MHMFPEQPHPFQQHRLPEEHKQQHRAQPQQQQQPPQHVLQTQQAVLTCYEPYRQPPPLQTQAGSGTVILQPTRAPPWQKTSGIQAATYDRRVPSVHQWTGVGANVPPDDASSTSRRKASAAVQAPLSVAASSQAGRRPLLPQQVPALQVQPQSQAQQQQPQQLYLPAHFAEDVSGYLSQQGQNVGFLCHSPGAVCSQQSQQPPQAQQPWACQTVFQSCASKLGFPP
ncbi:transcription factor SPT20 homolog [Schistocerca americana]|uniref:transcription factor SPT20 homolog n=1 Tax=Schistocerca americana TaxID=7009 RepID=UPI001F4F6DBE|nr:transcription factor SPT20 homolog [Schistocerca americana]